MTKIIDKQVDVSVCMLTYFHEKYLREAIESVLAQKTHYTYEIVICDDCSKDKTPEIIKEYEDRYPGKIRGHINNENIGIPRNIYQARCMCKGRYIVALSGDDYWIDEEKIEKEASFLDAHREYFVVFNCVELRVDDEKYPFDIWPSKKRRGKKYSIKDYENGNTIASHGFMMRNFFLTEEGRAYFHKAQEISDIVDDAVDMVLFLKRGPGYVIDEITDAHRVLKHEKGKNNYNTRYSKLEKFRHHIELYNSLDNVFGEEIDFSWWYGEWYSLGFLGMIITRNLAGYREIFKSIPYKYKKLSTKSIYLKLVPNVFKNVFIRLKNKIVAINER